MATVRLRDGELAPYTRGGSKNWYASFRLARGGRLQESLKTRNKAVAKEKEVGGVILEVNQGPSFDMHDASTNLANQVRNLVLRELFKGREGGQIPLVKCIAGDGFPAEAVAQLVLQKLHAKLGLTAGAAIPARGLAMVGSATIKTKDTEITPICDAILSDPRVEAALFLTGGEPIPAIPESARTLDFRLSKHSRSVEDIAEAIVLEFTSAAFT